MSVPLPPGAYAKALQEETFPELRVAVLHGRMKPKEKEKVMASFAAGESDILVSTTSGWAAPVIIMRIASRISIQDILLFSMRHPGLHRDDGFIVL